MNPNNHAPRKAQPAAQPQLTQSTLPNSFWDDLTPEEKCETKLQMLSLVVESAAEFLFDHHLKEPYGQELSNLLGYTLLEYKEALADLDKARKAGVA
ncbi:MAG: hypothetical protein MUF71_15770 [Candidatus Kapabacteria bacterium]|nr:hypothetical protein [Candidatus Kapabacteria bacterium]